MPIVGSRASAAASGFGWSSASTGLYPFTTFTFTNAGTEGTTGPSYSALLSTYSTQPWAFNTNFFDSSGGIQLWTVPQTGLYEIEAVGASGGRHLFGFANGSTGAHPKGAIIIARAQLTIGQKLNLIVGQEGGWTTFSDASEGDNAAPGGGGASWVYISATDTTPLVVAGGGAGGNRLSYNGDASLTTSGVTASSLANGGESGNGGRSNAGGSSYWAGGGAGWITDGTGGNQSTNYNYLPGSQGGQGGRAPQNGAFGGTRWNDGTDSGGNGGFGGGGGGGSDNMGTGGGGGFSGGGGGRSTALGGGGGGSFIDGSLTEVSKTVGSVTGHGYIKITRL